MIMTPILTLNDWLQPQRKNNLDGMFLVCAIERQRERPILSAPLRREGGVGVGDAGAMKVETDSSRLASEMRKD